MLGPRLEKIISEKEGIVILAKVDIDEHAEIAMDYGVSVIILFCLDFSVIESS